MILFVVEIAMDGQLQKSLVLPKLHILFHGVMEKMKQKLKHQIPQPHCAAIHGTTLP